MRRKILSIILVIAIASTGAFAAEELQYKNFKFDDVTCDVGILYKTTPGGMTIVVSAIPFGKGAEFRKWKISDIRLNVGGRKIRPNQTGRFYTTKENFWKVPSAVLFVVIAAQMPASGSALAKGITRTGAAIGLGLLVLAAKGEITGEKSTFDLDSSVADRIIDGEDAIEITVQHPDLHITRLVKVGIVKTPADPSACRECAAMTRSELLAMLDRLEARLKELEREQGAFRYGVDPRYDTIQRDIEAIQTRRGIAYKTYLEKGETG